MKTGIPAPFGILLLVASGLSAQSFDLGLDSSASYSQTAVTSASATQSLSLGLMLPLGRNARIVGRTAASASYSNTAGSSSLSYPGSLGGIDIPELSISFAGPVQEQELDFLSFALGRLPYIDSTAYLFAYRIDGMILGATWPLGTLRTVLGYTGFMPSSAPIVPSTADSSFGSGDFAPPRAVSSFSFRTPRVLGHEVYLAFTSQADMREKSQLVPEYETVFDSQSGGSASSGYLSTGFSGSPLAGLTWSGFGIYQVGRRLSYIEDSSSATGYSYRYSPLRAWLFGAQARYSLNPLLSLSFRGLVASGDADSSNSSDGNTEGDATLFLPMTRGSTGLVFSPLPGNLTQLELGLSFKPFPAERIGLLSVQLASSTFGFAKNAVGPVSEAGILPAAQAGLLGFEQDFNISVRLLSDTTLTTSLGAFMPLAGVYDQGYVDASPYQYLVRVGLSIAL